MGSNSFKRIPSSPGAKRQRLESFVGGMVHEDAEMVEAWRDRSPAEHAAAGAQLSDLAAQMSQQTGFGKDPDEMFPGFSSFRAGSEQDGS